jgi:hypothetical protein
VLILISMVDVVVNNLRLLFELLYIIVIPRLHEFSQDKVF